MMRRVVILMILLPALIAAGCAGTRKMAGDIEGIYYGYLPCASCPGIHYELSLNPDFTYSETMRYDGTNDLFMSEHSYKLTRDSVIILAGKMDDEGGKHFVFSGGKLEMLSIEGEKIESGFPERYFLTKDRPLIKEKTEPLAAAGFKATGNEPFWALEIEFHNLLIFTSLTEEFPELNFHMPDPERPGDLSLVKYSAKTFNAEMEVTISREECMDNMSGDLFPYTVNVSVRSSQRDDFTELKGCGSYLNSYRLNDIWNLEKIDGIEIEPKIPGRNPQLEIDLASKAIFGFGGCNRFHGRSELIRNSLLTGNIVSTKMACIDIQDIENKFLGALSGKTLEFSIDDSTMTMTDGVTELFFRRAE